MKGLTSAKSGLQLTSQERGKYAKLKQYNCKTSLFIPIDHVIIDTLHLFLRISDNLNELLIREIRRKDAIDKGPTFSNGFCRNRYRHMARYETFVKDLGISFEWKINKDTKKLEYRDLAGPEKLLLFPHINFHPLLSQCHDATPTSCKPFGVVSWILEVIYN